MKKLSKILASVLTVAMAMSTVVMPMTAEAADVTSYIWRTYTDIADINASLGLTPVGTVAQADGLAGKDASDKVLKLTGGHTGWLGGTWSDTVLTAEAQVYVPTGKLELYVGGQVGGGADDDRPGVYIDNGKFGYVNAKGWARTDICTVDVNTWHKVAFTMDRTAKTAKIYLDGELKHTQENVIYDSSFNQDMRFQTDGYIDNYRIYNAAYDPTSDVMPVAGGDHLFFSNTMTVAQVKAELMAEQDAEKAVAHVYTNGVGGTEAADTDTIKAGWYAVVTSKSGSLYKDVYKVVNSVEVGTVEYSGTTVTGTVDNNVENVIPAMTMILVQNGGKLVYSSETQYDIPKGTATFTIEGVDSLSNAKVFFVKDWSDPQAVLDDLYDVD